MEEKKITITRTKESTTYPADCIYILAMNPCACGGANCICTEKEILRYRKKISGPIADRIEIWISVSKVEYEKFSEPDAGNATNSKTMAARVRAARKCKANRNIDNGIDGGGNPKADSGALAFLAQSAEKMNISARAYMRTINVARTIADLEQSDNIKTKHIMEALQYRRKE
jgi:magnesium chelatase family protein